MLFLLPGKCHFLKEAHPSAPSPPSLGLTLPHLLHRPRMLEAASHSCNLTLAGSTRTACIPRAPVAEL